MGIKVPHTPMQAVGSGARLAGQAQALKRKQDKAHQAALQAQQLAAAADRQKSQLIAAAQRQQSQIDASAAIEELRARERAKTKTGYKPGKRPEKPGDKTPSSWKYDSDDPFSPTYQQPWEDDMGAYITPEVYKALQEKTVGAAPQERQGVMQQEKSFELPHYQEQYGALQRDLYERQEIDLDALYASYFTDEGKFETAKARLTASYRQEDIKGYKAIKQKEQEELRVQQLTKKPQDMTPSQEIAERLRLGQEAEGLVFDKEKPFSFTQMQSLGSFIQNTAERAEEESWKFGSERTRKSLIEQYKAAVNLLQVQDYGPVRQKQFNDAWNRIMDTDKKFKKWRDKNGKPPTEMKAIFATGRIADAMRDKVVTPMGRSLVKGKKSSLATTLSTLHPVASRVAGWIVDRGKATPEQPQQMLQVRTQVEYDQIPSGTQYKHPDGSIRTKQ